MLTTSGCKEKVQLFLEYVNRSVKSFKFTFIFRLFHVLNKRNNDAKENVLIQINLSVYRLLEIFLCYEFFREMVQFFLRIQLISGPLKPFET